MDHNTEFLKLVNDAKTRVREIGVNGYKQALQNGDEHTLVDVREDSEWKAGHVKGAVHMAGRSSCRVASSSTILAMILFSRTGVTACDGREARDGRAESVI